MGCTNSPFKRFKICTYFLPQWHHRGPFPLGLHVLCRQEYCVREHLPRHQICVLGGCPFNNLSYPVPTRAHAHPVGWKVGTPRGAPAPSARVSAADRIARACTELRPLHCASRGDWRGPSSSENCNQRFSGSRCRSGLIRLPAAASRRAVRPLPPTLKV